MILPGVIEQAMRERLAAASVQGVLGYAIRTLDTLPEDLDEDLPSLISSFPAVWTVYGGWRKIGDQGDGGVIADLTFSLIAAAENLRNLSAARHGDGGEVGSLQMIMDAVGLLAGRDLGLPIGPLTAGDQKPLITGKANGRKLSLFAQAFTTRVTIDVQDEPDALLVQPMGDFRDFAVAWDVPPFDPDAPDLHTLQTLPAEEP